MKTETRSIYVFTRWPSWGSHASEKRANRSRFALDRFKKIQYNSDGIPIIRLFVRLTYTALANDDIHNNRLLVTAMCTSVMLDDDELKKKWKKIDEEIIFFWRLPESIKYVQAVSKFFWPCSRTHAEERSAHADERNTCSDAHAEDRNGQESVFSVFFADQPTSTVHDF